MTSIAVVNYYEILGITNDATTKDINSAYKRLALKHHPDKSGGSTESIDEFRKIQQAVETLRDPHRRSTHDAHLARQRKLDDHVLFSASYHGWRPQNPFWYNMRNSNARYMYSYANSVHMDPFSNESLEERERCEADVRFGEEIRREQEVEERRAEEERVRREEMERERERERERFGRAGFWGGGFGSAYFAASFQGSNFRGYEGGGWREQNEEGYTQMEEEFYYGCWDGEEDEQHSCDYAEWDAEDEQGEDQQFEEGDEALHHDNGNDQEHDCEVMEEGVQLDKDVNLDEEVKPDEACDDSFNPVTPSQQSHGHNPAEDYTHQETPIPEESNESDEPENKENQGGIPLSEADQEPAIFYECYSDEDSFTDAHSQISSSFSPPRSSVPQPPESELPPETNPYLAPFIPYFNAKLNHPSGRYTQEDMHVEFQGIVMETFCGWLEGVRQTFTHAQPLPTHQSKEQCLHLGPWEKEFEHVECEACHRWMPVYTLTCPGCGCKACVGSRYLSSLERLNLSDGSVIAEDRYRASNILWFDIPQ
ncbi:DnaJ-domain-containing protein [Aspergillus campestris IBT 28561]|uniref:DnaJ-domain-containing protein n=1 Tax=Aspergillus campestris (strain IBT 28561) TaxID=1392248 RepID=A0A2I1D4N7_ASPC2|nr:DnaJ-domain-containing protein [Aspergillus campestris IBT 28561]PKY04851.1 DnaJ-domain-containing protein [Aspergillus campestris IBT 28561]